MSFSAWKQKPPFPESQLTQGERIYARAAGLWKPLAEVGAEEVCDQWLITDTPALAIQQNYDDAFMLSFASLKAQVLTEARDLRTQLFARFDGLQASANARGDSAQATEIETVKQALRDMTTTVDLTGLSTLDQMRAAFALAWKTLAAGCSTALKTAFAGLDQ